MELLRENSLKMAEYRDFTHQTMKTFFEKMDSTGPMHKAALYAMENTGKALRPILLLEFCRISGGDWHKALPAAAALELIHTFSLVHDDLPCMDNDDFRRGKPSCHKVFGETAALLAGDALGTASFSLLTQIDDLPGEVVLRLARELASATSLMIYGQEMDIYLTELTDGHPDLPYMIKLVNGKTSALIAAACRMGVLAAEGDSAMVDRAGKFGEALGIAFQIRDDILDVVGSQELLGKPIGSDQANGKVTFPSLIGLEESEKLAEAYTKTAVDALNAFSDTSFLLNLADCLLTREQ